MGNELPPRLALSTQDVGQKRSRSILPGQWQGEFLPGLLGIAPGWSIPKPAPASLQRRQAELVQVILGTKLSTHPVSHWHSASIHPAMGAVQVCPSPAAPGKAKTNFSPTASPEQPWHCQDTLALPFWTLHTAFSPHPTWLGSTVFPQQGREAPKDEAHHISPAFQVRPETERYEWVFIKKPELAKAVPRSRQRSPSPVPASLLGSSPNSSNSSSNRLTVPAPQRRDRLSPFLAIRHFLLPSKTASMFMSGSREGIVIGNYRTVGTPPTNTHCFGREGLCWRLKSELPGKAETSCL